MLSTRDIILYLLHWSFVNCTVIQGFIFRSCDHCLSGKYILTSIKFGPMVVPHDLLEVCEQHFKPFKSNQLGPHNLVQVNIHLVTK